jgi:hypothetical protein
MNGEKKFHNQEKQQSKVQRGEIIRKKVDNIDNGDNIDSEGRTLILMKNFTVKQKIDRDFENLTVISWFS